MDKLETLRFELNRPLLLIKAQKGFLACGYISIETCNKTGDACAIVAGVNNYEDMHKASVVAASKTALELGVQIGEAGESALHKMSEK